VSRAHDRPATAGRERRMTCASATFRGRCRRWSRRAGLSPGGDASANRPTTPLRSMGSHVLRECAKSMNYGAFLWGTPLGPAMGRLFRAKLTDEGVAVRQSSSSLPSHPKPRPTCGRISMVMPDRHEHVDSSALLSVCNDTHCGVSRMAHQIPQHAYCLPVKVRGAPHPLTRFITDSHGRMGGARYTTTDDAHYPRTHDAHRAVRGAQ
jgi:hypothetical protein